jgi:hypothetical protein
MNDSSYNAVKNYELELKKIDLFLEKGSDPE